jgi:anaphase-promoting complex subunit 6
MYLRGIIHMNQNNFDRAKEFFLKAVQVDARCYQAYDQLITNSLLDPDEGASLAITYAELALLNNLNFQGIPADTREFIRLIYLTKLNKVRLFIH